MLTSLKLHNKKAYPIEDRPFYFIYSALSSTLISALVGALSAWLAESTSFVTCSKVPVVSCETFTVCTSVITPSIPKMVRTVLMVDCKFNPVSESKTDDVSNMSVVNES